MTAARAQTAGDSGGTEGVGGGEAPPLFRQAVAALEGVRHRAEVSLRPLPAPKRLAPYAYALEVSVEDAGQEVADGRFVLLHDPGEPESWQGAFRVVTLVRAELEPEMAADPLLPEVTWSWLTGALEARPVAYAEAGGTVTRAGSHFFGGLAERAPHSELEIRASWTPLPPAAPQGAAVRAALDAAAHLAAWCDMVCQCAGLPPAALEDGDGETVGGTAGTAGTAGAGGSGAGAGAGGTADAAGAGGPGGAAGTDGVAGVRVLPLPQRRGPQRR